ncbi:hypothetical protein GGQ97_000191 [Sphingomonas kaistensis]|uniref:Alpha/beta hydrolase domain-containing protein n=1 Tax=Sphingomonas kaistensis TaxID=298708 RepID=A0A7X5Y465_9SPHN|nr:alpha/beta hydrolase domain-containing protein [Sphingomonas kaistensis]NJC04398.1 hypothetical protein [Sphingomonas kaistensis]
MRWLIPALMWLSALVALAPGRAEAAEVRRAPAPTASSPMWLDPAEPGSTADAALRRAGYVREEWFQSGVANVYGDGLAVVQRGVPYVTRLIVIRPRDPRRFSGTVQLNPAHPFRGNDNWQTLAPYVLERGDAFVSVMSGADENTRRARPGPVPVMAPLTLRWFNPERYAPLRWPAEEDGIRWDVLTDSARLLRDPAGPLRGLAVRRVFSSGWSFTGSLLRTFINEGFHDRARTASGRPLIDGYLIGISGFSFRSGYLPLNGRLPMPGVDDPRRPNRPVDVPVIELQSENEAITNREPQTPDRDRSPGAHRLYELPGTTHGSGGLRTFLAERQIAWRLKQPFAPPVDACPYQPSDIDIAAFARAAHANLERWVREGVPPPRAARLRHRELVQVRDSNGNTLGGIRPAQIAVPLARYGKAPEGSNCDQAAPGIGSPAIPMRRVPLSRERLRQLYPGGATDYLRRFDAAVDGLVRAGWLRSPEARVQKAEARRQAASAFR